MPKCSVYCAWCGEHEFRVDLYTVEEAGIMVLKCPACQKVTTLGKRPGHELNVIAGSPGEPTASKKND